MTGHDRSWPVTTGHGKRERCWGEMWSSAPRPTSTRLRRSSPTTPPLTPDAAWPPTLPHPDRFQWQVPPCEVNKYTFSIYKTMILKKNMHLMKYRNFELCSAVFSYVQLCSLMFNYVQFCPEVWSFLWGCFWYCTLFASSFTMFTQASFSWHHLGPNLSTISASYIQKGPPRMPYLAPLGRMQRARAYAAFRFEERLVPLDLTETRKCDHGLTSCFSKIS